LKPYLTLPYLSASHSVEVSKTSSFQALPFFLCLRYFRLNAGCRPSRFQLSCPRSADTAMLPNLFCGVPLNFACLA